MRWIAFVLILILTACSTAPPPTTSIGPESLRGETDASLAAKLIKGKTTKDEVRAIFGAPSLSSIGDNGNEHWTFQLSDVNSGSYVPLVGNPAPSVQVKYLNMVFDKRGRLVNYTLSELNNGIASPKR